MCAWCSHCTVLFALFSDVGVGLSSKFAPASNFPLLCIGRDAGRPSTRAPPRSSRVVSCGLSLFLAWWEPHCSDCVEVGFSEPLFLHLNSFYPFRDPFRAPCCSFCPRASRIENHFRVRVVLSFPCGVPPLTDVFAGEAAAFHSALSISYRSGGGGYWLRGPSRGISTIRFFLCSYSAAFLRTHLLGGTFSHFPPRGPFWLSLSVLSSRLHSACREHAFFHRAELLPATCVPYRICRWFSGLMTPRSSSSTIRSGIVVMRFF